MKAAFLAILFCLMSQGYVFAEIKPIHIANHQFESKILDEKRELVVYLPESYQDKEKRFPVLYITDGNIQGPHTKGTLDFLNKFDQSPDMIVVGIVNPGNTRVRDLTVSSKTGDGDDLNGADRFLAFVEQEAIPFIKSQYRTLEYQALSGTSHGGQFAINAIVKRPGLFDGIIAISPSLYWNKKQLLQLSKMALKEHQLQGRLFVSIANEEKVMTEPYKELVNLFKQYPNNKLFVESKTFDEENHDTTTLLGQYYGLKHLFSGWALPQTPMNLDDLKANFNGRSQLLGIDLNIPEDRANGYGQWLQYLNRQQEALSLLEWNRDTYPQSLSTHETLIKAYMHFNLPDKAKLALRDAKTLVKSLDSNQVQELETLILK